MHISFKKWLEAVMTGKPTTSGGGIGIDDNDNDDDDGDDDDPQWRWDNIQKRYGASLQKWCETSPCAKKIKRALAEMVFKEEPKTDGIDIYSNGELDRYSERVPPEGYAELRLRYILPYEKFEDKLLNTLRNAKLCDLWRAFNIRPEEIWNFLDKGYVFNYTMYAIVTSLTNYMNVNNGFNLEKYANFIAHDSAEKYEQEARDTILDYYNMDRKQRATNVDVKEQTRRARAQIYGASLMAEILYQWSYKAW